jgi:energy-coupling factor transport system substrate-specific component
VQGLVAAGVNPDRVTRGGSRTPLAYLRSLQTADGAVRYSRTSRQTPVWVTAQALTAFARRPFPVAAPRPPASARRSSAAAPRGLVAVAMAAAVLAARLIG